ncbi:hypothetical protein NQ317_010908 [Molorchus minor]|uniref:Uncharacterized protein n=1 Tax=Molorchus minor TaxID=1323400 RepID=A0ABQ9J883_9CUCU|nr:hypothetical protein NQ317_010908 [Molorchus minor]
MRRLTIEVRISLSFDTVSSISNCKLNQPAELRDLGAVTTAVTPGPMTICFMRIDKFPGPAFKYAILLNANISGFNVSPND